MYRYYADNDKLDKVKWDKIKVMDKQIMFEKY